MQIDTAVDKIKGKKLIMTIVELGQTHDCMIQCTKAANASGARIEARVNAAKGHFVTFLLVL